MVHRRDRERGLALYRLRGLPAVALVLLAGCDARLPLHHVAALARSSTAALLDGGARWTPGPGGCAVFVSRNELLTVAHALKGGGGISIRLFDGSEVEAEVDAALSGRAATSGATVVDDVRRDLALLRLRRGSAPTWLRIGVEPGYGETVVAVGAPAGAFGAAISGLISRSPAGTILGRPLEPGWSGAGLVSRRGRLVGIVARGSESVSLAVPADALRAGLEELRR